MIQQFEPIFFAVELSRKRFIWLPTLNDSDKFYIYLSSVYISFVSTLSEPYSSTLIIRVHLDILSLSLSTITSICYQMDMLAVNLKKSPNT